LKTSQSRKSRSPKCPVPKRLGLFPIIGCYLARPFAEGGKLTEEVLGGKVATPQETLPSAMLGTGLSGTRFRGRPEITPAQTRLQDFTAQGVTPNIPVVGQGRAQGLAAQAGRILPFSPVRRGFDQALTDTSQAAERSAAGFGTATDEFAAGAGARNALRGYAADKSQAAADYGTFERLMHGAPPVQMDRTLSTLRDFRGRFPNAPQLTGLFTNPKLSRLSEGLEPRTQTIPPQTSQMLDQFGRPAVTRPAETVTTGGKLTMPELRELRSQIGYMLENPSFGPEDIPRGQLKQLYGSLTADMRRGAQAAGPAAVKALNQATINYGTRMRFLDRLEPLINPDAPEKVFARIENAAKATGSADAGLLQAAKAVMPPEAWNNVGAAFIRRLGNPVPGQPRVTGVPEFSINTYGTNWNKLSDRAKDLMFGPDTPGSPRAGLEQLSRVVSSMKAVGSLANTSKTFEVGATGAFITLLMDSLVQGRLPIRELAGYAGATGAAKLLMSPALTRVLYKMPDIAAQSQSIGSFQDLAFNALKAELVVDAARPPALPPPQQQQRAPGPPTPPPLQYPYLQPAR
jgi:hypothetical protein